MGELGWIPAKRKTKYEKKFLVISKTVVGRKPSETKYEKQFLVVRVANIFLQNGSRQDMRFECGLRLPKVRGSSVLYLTRGDNVTSYF